jgi:hypothetical protein
VLQALDTFLAFTETQKRRTLLRSDAGFGSDANMNLALAGQWQIVTKSSSGRRPATLARQVADDAWLELRPNDRWVAPVTPPHDLVCPTQWLALRWRTQRGDLKHGVVVCSVRTWSPAEVIAQYDARGGCETEIRADKGGLLLSRRRKKVLAAQEALVLLTDLAHNLLAWATPWMWPTGALAQLGPLQLIQDLLTLPGHLIFHEQRLAEIQLNIRHPYAREVAAGLERLLDHFGYP